MREPWELERGEGRIHRFSSRDCVFRRINRTDSHQGMSFWKDSQDGFTAGNEILEGFTGRIHIRESVFGRIHRIHGT